MQGDARNPLLRSLALVLLFLLLTSCFVPSFLPFCAMFSFWVDLTESRIRHGKAYCLDRLNLRVSPLSSLVVGGLWDRLSSSGKWLSNLQSGIIQAMRLFDSKACCLDHVPTPCCSAPLLLVVTTRRNFSNTSGFETLSLQFPLLVPPLPVLFGCMPSCNMPWAVGKRDRMSMLELGTHLCQSRNPPLTFVCTASCRCLASTHAKTLGSYLLVANQTNMTKLHPPHQSKTDGIA